MAKVLQFVKDYLSQRKEKMDVISYLEEQLELKDLQNKAKMPYKDGKTIHDIEMRFITEDNQMDIFDFIK